jgi:hypothetical protein
MSSPPAMIPPTTTAMVVAADRERAGRPGGRPAVTGGAAGVDESGEALALRRGAARLPAVA